jgi:hypothetical protein
MLSIFNYMVLLPRQYMTTPASLSMVRKSKRTPFRASTSPDPTPTSEPGPTALHEHLVQTERVVKDRGNAKPARTGPQQGMPQRQQQEAATVATKDEEGQKTAEQPAATAATENGGGKKKATKPAAHKTPFQQALEEAQNSQRGTEPIHQLFGVWILAASMV